MDSLLIVGRASLGAGLGLAIGWPTQKERHSRYVVGWVLVGFFAGVIAMWPHWGHVIASLAMLPISVAVGTFIGFYIGVATLGDREDWWLRSWGFAGFVVAFQLLAVLCSALIMMSDESG